MVESSFVNLEELPGHLVRRAQQVHAGLWSACGPKAVTSPQFAVLADLAEHPGSSQIRVSERVGIDRSTLAELVTRMVKRGLVHRSVDPNDARRKLLDLSGAGEVVHGEGVAAVVEVNRRLVQGLTSGERTDLLRLLSKLVAES